MTDFADLAWLFCCDNRNRGVIRMNFDEAALLWKAARASAGDLLEIGSRHGGSTVLLMLAARGRRVVSIDRDPNWDARAAAVLDGTVTQLVADSRQPLPGRTFGFALIDGDHSADGVAADVAAHWPAIEPGGLVAFHDALPNGGLKHDGRDNHCAGVLAACERLIASGQAGEWGRAGSLWVLRKTADCGMRIAE